MNDRELLELAARAYFAGFDLVGDKDMQRYASRWKPLDDNDAAFSLAVKFKMIVNVCVDTTIVDKAGMRDYFTEPHGLNAERATRRAIVRAAAEIGKSLQEQPQ